MTQLTKSFFNLGTGDTPDSLSRKSSAPKQGCEGCGLYRDCLSPKMKASGEGKLGVLLVGEASGRTEDEKGIQFIGSSGADLEDALDDLGIDMRKDCRLINACACRPNENGKNKTPTDPQITACRPRVLKEIADFKPKVIILLGVSAVQSVLGHKLSGRLKGLKNTSLYSEQIPDQDYMAWICPTYHPAFFLYDNNKKDKVAVRKWKKDIEKAIYLAKNEVEFPKIDLKNRISITDSVDKACDILTNTLEDKPGTLAFDYETTGIKPHRDGQHIVCASIAYNDQAYAFPFFYDSEEFMDLWYKVMTHPGIRKVAHKMDFENGWTHARAGGYWVRPWAWDTCLAAHCINNTKPTSLKFLTYTNFGIIGYDDGVDKFIRTNRPGEDSKSGNRFNNIKQAPLLELLKYNAMDSYFSLKLADKQAVELNRSREQYEGFLFLLDGTETLSRIQQQGIRVDTKQMKVQIDRLTKRMGLAEKKILGCEEVKKWKGSVFNFSSNQQLSKLLYDILGYEKGKVDIEALKKIDSDFTNNILKFKKYKKIRDTYLAQYTREEINGVLHPFFNLHIVPTFRSSSDSPNFQNVPIRDKQAMQIVRSIIRPSPGNILKEFDFKGMEVCLSACYHKDPNMIKYITDPSADMHRDVAMELFFRTKDDFTEKDKKERHERYTAKNGFVFPAFYGSSSFPMKGKTIGEMTRNIWDAIEGETKKHLQEKGIQDIRDFQKHIEIIEKYFWDERFPVYKEWKQITYKEYEKKGYVDLYTGFRCYGPLRFTQVTNYPIQGSAFHCLLWTLNQVEPKVKAISERSSIIGQIHDSIVMDMCPDDEEKIDEIVKLWGTEKIREHWDWICVPLSIEMEKSEVDGSWDEMHEGGLL